MCKTLVINAYKREWVDVGDNSSMNSLDSWLAHCERLHPHTIDMGLERVQEVVKRLGLHFEACVITVAGTNGKGSTCAMLEA